MEFNSNKIRGLMAEKRMTQKKLAEALGVSTLTVRSKLSAKTDFNATEISKMSELFMVDPNVFFDVKLTKNEIEA
jgi:transcriptional regulator with XRE-family HTH domain